MDQVLSRDVPKLMNQFPPEREDAGQAAQAAPVGVKEAAPVAGGNPFDPFSGATTGSASKEWSISVSEQTNYRNIFASSSPQDGKLSGAAAKMVLTKSKLETAVLGKIWVLSDIDQDGYLDEDEFCVAMHLCHQALSGKELPTKLPELTIPPSKRHLAADSFA
eukprot:TRINITY_DN7837_c0_g1_i4.p2 TRINITY_DN7837_c0_g1~~TRINITY_DN7837_c0_g1_i4.p2  ORF type:complete len:163 (+),score=50.47 TRINITY_DN7837_c0_g1_i4:1347-1835(+)